MPSVTANPLHNPVSAAPSSPERVAIVADDLTGACDSAAAFLHAGRAVRVWLGDRARFSAPEPVQAFNTDSRALAPAHASRAVARAAAQLAQLPGALLFKKVDSAARGPFAAEILAARRGFQARAVLLAPAFPAAGRTVRNGVLHIADAAGTRAGIDLAGRFPSRSRALIQPVSGPDALAAAFHSGKPVLLCDSATQSDLEALVRTAETLPGLLFAGSAGLARALAARDAECSYPMPPLAARTLIVAGTDHPVTKLQLQNLDREPAGAHQVLRISCLPGDGAQILDAFRGFQPQAVILTGGDTALLAARTLGAHSFILRGELAPGIPWGTMQGGAAEGCTVITKSGGFGTPTIFNQILAALRGSQ